MNQSQTPSFPRKRRLGGKSVSPKLLAKRAEQLGLDPRELLLPVKMLLSGEPVKFDETPKQVTTPDGVPFDPTMFKMDPKRTPVDTQREARERGVTWDFMK